MLPTEDLFACVYVMVDDSIISGAIAIPPRPGPAPACSDAELLTIALVRHLLGRRSEAGFLAEAGRDWARLFPVLPHQSEANRRIRWLWGAFEQFRAALAASEPASPRLISWRGLDRGWSLRETRGCRSPLVSQRPFPCCQPKTCSSTSTC